MWFSYNYLKQKALKKIWKKKDKRENFEWERANFVLERERDYLPTLNFLGFL